MSLAHQVTTISMKEVQFTQRQVMIIHFLNDVKKINVMHEEKDAKDGWKVS